ncbi:MAG: hypothetical protein WDN07_03380 [Actinomycetota bacterium]
MLIIGYVDTLETPDRCLHPGSKTIFWLILETPVALSTKVIGT